MKRCEYCHIHGNRHGNSRLCRDCRANGKRWCSIGQHVVDQSNWQRNTYGCLKCGSRYRQSRYGSSPPPLYRPMREVAQLMGYHSTYISRCIQRGWMAGYVWRRMKHSTWYVEDRDTYPPLPTKRAT